MKIFFIIFQYINCQKLFNRFEIGKVAIPGPDKCIKHNKENGGEDA